MRNILFLCFLLSIVGCSTFSPKSFPEEVLNDKLITLDRDSITLKNILDKHPDQSKFIQVFASYCPYSQDSFDDVLAFQKANPEKTYIFLSVDHGYHDWKRGLEYVKPKGEFYFIPEKDKGILGEFLKIKTIPRFLNIDKDGKIKVFKTSKVTEKLK